MKMSKNNKGFSLVEVLIAVTILAIIVAPFLHSFATAARTSAKSKRILQATTVGQNLMERMKGASMDSFLDGWTKSMAADADGLEYYELNNAPMIDGREYYVRMYLDDSNFKTASGSATQFTDYNSTEWANIPNLSRANNAFFIANVNETTEVAKGLAKKLSVATIDETKLERELKIAVTYDEASKHAVVKASVIYSYEGTSYPTLSDQEIYNNGTNLNNELQNVFICYFPMKKSSSSDYLSKKGNVKETIKIENPNNCEIGVHLVRQGGGDTPPQDSHAVNILVEETARSSLPLDADGKIVPATTLSTNLYEDQAALGYTGSGIPSGKDVKDMVDFSFSKKMGATVVNGLERGKAANRIYQVKIKVYRKDEGGNYDQDNLLTTLEGTKTE